MRTSDLGGKYLLDTKQDKVERQDLEVMVKAAASMLLPSFSRCPIRILRQTLRWSNLGLITSLCSLPLPVSSLRYRPHPFVS
jgi:hypothetical protein